jgi:hypothetical protein
VFCAATALPAVFFDVPPNSPESTRTGSTSPYFILCVLHYGLKLKRPVLCGLWTVSEKTDSENKDLLL